MKKITQSHMPTLRAYIPMSFTISVFVNECSLSEKAIKGTHASSAIGIMRRRHYHPSRNDREGKSRAPCVVTLVWGNLQLISSHNHVSMALGP